VWKWAAGDLVLLTAGRDTVALRSSGGALTTGRGSMSSSTKAAAWLSASGWRRARGAETASLCRQLVVLIVVLLAAAAYAPAALAKPVKYLAHDQQLVKLYVALEQGKLPGIAPPSIVVSEVATIPASRPGEFADGDTDCSDANGQQIGPVTSCDIHMAKLAHVTSVEDRATVAHEVFHAFEAVMAGTMSNFAQEVIGSSWLIEGAAAWVESDLVSNDVDARDYYWLTYLANPTTPLFKRKADGGYGAIGFFGHMSSSGISPWTAFPPMFAATTNEAAYAASGVGKSFLDGEASVFFENRSLGSAWYQNGQSDSTANQNVPNPASVKVHLTPEMVTTVKRPPLTVAPYADGVYDVTAKAPVLELSVDSGSVRLRSTAGGQVDELDPTNLLLCSRPKGCSCPGMSSVSYPQFKRGDLAVTGGITGGSVQLTGLKPCNVSLPGVSCDGLLDPGDFPGADTEYTIPPLNNANRGFVLSNCIYASSDPTSQAGGADLLEVFAPFEVRLAKGNLIPVGGDGGRLPGSTTLHGVGERAYISQSTDDDGVVTQTGTMQVLNDLFVVNAAAGVDIRSLLSEVAAELCPSCKF
jgi:hypothetical protein